MKKYYCDICGKVFDPAKGGHKAEWTITQEGYLGLATAGFDVCKNCMDIGKKVDFLGAMRDAWESAVMDSLKEVK